MNALADHRTDAADLGTDIRASVIDESLSDLHRN